MNEWDKVNEASNYIRNKAGLPVDTGIILGTGLDKLADKVKDACVINYEEIPYFPVATVESHRGNLVIGKIGEKRVVAMQGRFHLYEGYTPVEIAFPIRVMKLLGITKLFESNAAGGLNPQFKKGDIVVIADHINLTGLNPLAGKNDERFGVRFPDMSCPYDEDIIACAEKIAVRERVPLKKGVLTGLLGPNLETKAEYRYLRLIGTDMVCLSTIPEVIAAVHLGLKIFGLSVITDMCLPDALTPTSIEEIIGTASRAEPELTRLLEKVIIEG